LTIRDAGLVEVEKSNSLQIYYEPTEDEKANGFNVMVFMKHYVWGNGSADCRLKRLEVFGI